MAILIQLVFIPSITCNTSWTGIKYTVEHVSHRAGEGGEAVRNATRLTTKVIMQCLVTFTTSSD
jgi:hypothetical protein